MAYPSTYERVAGVSGFTTHSANFPTTPHSGVNLDAELNAIRARLLEHQSFVALHARSDGALANGVVTQDSLATEIYAGINEPSAWVTATAYTLRDSVTINGKFYKCIVAHTSGTFSTDLAALKWELLIDFAELIGDIVLSDTTPTTISAGAGTAGVGDFAARYDHSHPYTEPTVPTYTTDLTFGGVKTADFSWEAGRVYAVIATATAITAYSPASLTITNRVEFAKVGTRNFTVNLNGHSFNGSTTNPVSAEEGISTMVYTGAGRGLTEG